MTDSTWDAMGPRQKALTSLEAATDALTTAKDAPTGDEFSAAMEESNEHMQRFRDAHRQAVERPHGGWIGAMCRGLGELPDLARPQRDEFTDLRQYRVLPYLTLLILLGFIIITALLVPLAVLSPVTATGRAIGGDGGQLWASRIVVFVLTAVVLGFFVIKGVHGVKRALYRFALDEELWFRFGAENWSTWQRVRSCAQFGVAHLANLVLALVTLGGLAVVGRVFMWVYLREVRESGDPRRAAVVAAQFHATYNWGALMVLLCGAVLTCALYALELLL